MRTEMKLDKKKILVTGGAGFIGSNFIKTVCCQEEIKKNYSFVILDALTYAGHYPSIANEIEEEDHLSFKQVDLRNEKAVDEAFKDSQVDGVIHFAAESHVDRSIDSPNIFLETNVLGTLNLLKASLQNFQKYQNSNFRFLQVSTDEVYGSLGLQDPSFSETSPLAPNSPYSASKASADLLVRSFFKTYNLPVITTRCSNNYGPYQFPEKFIPLMIDNAFRQGPLPVYGQGLNIRDWIYVDDHNRGIWLAFREGKPGEIYNFGGNAEYRNIEVVRKILHYLKQEESLIKFVNDRPGHDFRYSVEFSKSEKELGWSPTMGFEEGLKKTIEWYRENQNWVNAVRR